VLAQCFKRNYRKVVVLSSVVVTVTAFAITGFALAASNHKQVRTACVAKAAKLQILRDTDAPLFR
jgi:hypothetical protein